MYPPAPAFEQPVASAAPWRLADVSLAELTRNSAAREILMKHLPSLQAMVGSPMLKPHLGNMTVYSLASFGKVLPADVIAAIDADLARLPPIDGAAR